MILKSANKKTARYSDITVPDGGEGGHHAIYVAGLSVHPEPDDLPLADVHLLDGDGRAAVGVPVVTTVSTPTP